MANLIQLPADVQRLIAYQLPVSDIYHLMLTSHYFYQILNQKLLWSTLYARDFTAQPIKEDPRILYRRHAKELVLNSTTHDKYVPYVAYRGFEKRIQTLIRQKVEWFGLFLINGALGGHEHIVKMMLNYNIADADLNWALRHGAGSGNVNIVKLLLKRGATSLNPALILAASRNREKVALTLVAYGATELDLAIENAKYFKHENMVRLLKKWKKNE